MGGARLCTCGHITVDHDSDNIRHISGNYNKDKCAVKGCNCKRYVFDKLGAPAPKKKHKRIIYMSQLDSSGKLLSINVRGRVRQSSGHKDIV